MKTLKIDGYQYETTGGGDALVMHIGEDVEIMLTDDNMSAPESWPLIVVWKNYETGEAVAETCADESELRAFERKHI